MDNKELIKMPLRDINILLRRLENELVYWQNEKMILFESSQISAVDTTKERVIGGKTPDDKAGVDRIIDTIDPKIKYINELIIEIKRIILKKETKLKEDKKWAELIAYYREDKLIVDSKTKRLRNLHWQEISSELKYNKDHCRKIYRNYRKK